MPKNCYVPSCKNNWFSGTPIKYFRFPEPSKVRTDLVRKRQIAWLVALRRNLPKSGNAKNLYVCSDHFILGKPAKLTDERHPDWIPSLKLGLKTSRKTSKVQAKKKIDRYLRLKHRTEKPSAKIGSLRTDSTKNNANSGNTTHVDDHIVPYDNILQDGNILRNKIEFNTIVALKEHSYHSTQESSQQSSKTKIYLVKESTNDPLSLEFDDSDGDSAEELLDVKLNLQKQIQENLRLQKKIEYLEKQIPTSLWYDNETITKIKKI